MDKITSKQIIEASADYYRDSDSFEWHGIEIFVNKVIPFMEMADYVNTVVGGCFTEEGDYVPQMKDYIINKLLILKYSNIELPEDYNEIYDFIYKTDIVSQIISRIDSSQFNSIINSINEKISLRKQTNITSFEKNIKDITNKLDDMKLVFSTLFDGISSEDINNLVSAMSSNGIDESKVVDAYIDKMRESDDNGGN